VAKASLVTTMKSNIIIGAVAHKRNEHDSKTLEAVLSHANKHRTKPIIEAICDRGYRGKKEVEGTVICTLLMILFLVKIAYFTYLLRHIRAEEREKYAKLYLMFYRLW